MMAFSLVQISRNLECRVCGRTCRDPRNLTCSHTFCRVCLETLLASHLRTDVLLCPTCRRGTWIPGGDVDGLQSNITVRSCQKHPNYDPLPCGSFVNRMAISPNNEMAVAGGLFLFGGVVIRNSEEGERIDFRPQGSDGLHLVQQIRGRTSRWELRALLPVRDRVAGIMAISPNNELTVPLFWGCGMVVYSSEGIILGTVLKDVFVSALDFMPETGYVIRNYNNRIFLYTNHSEKLDVTFETMDVANGTSGGLTVGTDGLIFVGYNVVGKIQVFKSEGGKAIREITCSGFQLMQIFAMTSSQLIVVKSGYKTVHVINDVSGAIIHSISKDCDHAFPAVYKDNAVIIALVKGSLLSIVQYTKEPNKYIKNILTDFKISDLFDPRFVQAFKTGEIALCTSDRLYIFHETWE